MTVINETHVINELCRVARERYGDNAVEALVGALASVCTPEQLETLLTRWRARVQERK